MKKSIIICIACLVTFALVVTADELATPLVGRVDPDERGIYGVEAQYDDLMTGVPGSEEFESSRFGSISVADWRLLQW